MHRNILLFIGVLFTLAALINVLTFSSLAFTVFCYCWYATLWFCWALAYRDDQISESYKWNN